MFRNRWLAPFATMFIFLLAGCATEAPREKHGDLKLLANWLSGSFSSEQQAMTDSNYYYIGLEMVPIWKSRTDGYWLYVEQAENSTPDKPYRQRVYHLTQINDSTFKSTVYAIPEPARFVGLWAYPDPLADLTPDSLILRDGCSIVLKKIDDQAFAGGTIGTGCESTRAGAAYVTSEVRVTAGALYSWDRGFDAEGNQVWGAEHGGYIFTRIGDAP